MAADVLSSRQSFSYKAKYHGLVWLYTAKKKKNSCLKGFFNGHT
jgi:hypothetical protein